MAMPGYLFSDLSMENWPAMSACIIVNTPKLCRGQV